jgi:drug/metabolite transporter (DMT)-like permease
VARGYLPLLLRLGAIWGASFMFIEVADRELAPATRVSGLRLAGVVAGLAGVAVLTGVEKGGWWAIAGTLAVVLASFSYAVGALYAQYHMGRVPVLVFSTAQSIAGALVLLPFGLAQLPSHVPGWKPIGSVLALGVAGTAVGTLLYYRLVGSFGSSRPLSAQKLVGMALVLGGVALGSGLVGWARRPAPVAE